MHARWVVIVTVLVAGWPAAADTPVGYECAPGTPKKGVGCTCPAGHTSKLDGDKIARCVALPKAAAASKCPAGMVQVAGDNKKRKPFCIDKIEVTTRAYTECVTKGGCTPAGKKETTEGRPELAGRPAMCNYGKEGREEHPINCLRWDQAASFCRAAGKRLPTQEEWVWTATGGAKAFVHPWGQDAPSDKHVCWKRGATCEVGAFPDGATPTGILDLAANVWEMTSSRQGTNIVVCGGGFYEATAQSVISTRCETGDPEVQFHDLGVRCVK
jgi:formylglycine-generating enzyme required for sulfatase activity